MEAEELYEEAEKILESTNLSDVEKNVIIRTAHKQANRFFYSQYDEWEEYQKKNKIVGKYRDEEVIRRLITKYVRDEIEKKSKEEHSGR